MKYAKMFCPPVCLGGEVDEKLFAEAFPNAYKPPWQKKLEEEEKKRGAADKGEDREGDARDS